MSDESWMRTHLPTEVECPIPYCRAKIGEPCRLRDGTKQKPNWGHDMRWGALGRSLRKPAA